MKITWIEIKNVKEYVDAMLKWQADDIPKELIDRGTWVQRTIQISEVQAEQSMVDDHDNDPIHIKRRDGFIESIQVGAPILPLIILNCDRGEKYLVDGYARYRALKEMGVKEVHVLCQTD
jgi:ParB-like nuclease domain